MPDEPVPDDAAGLRAANARLRELLAERDADIAGLEARLDEERELRRRLKLRLAEMERRLGIDSTDSGTPSSKERIGAKEARLARQQSERARRIDRKRGGQPGHQGGHPEGDRVGAAGPGVPVLRCGVLGRVSVVLVVSLAGWVVAWRRRSAWRCGVLGGRAGGCAADGGAGAAGGVQGACRVRSRVRVWFRGGVAGCGEQLVERQ